MITIKLDYETAKWLRAEMGRRPTTDREAGEVFLSTYFALREVDPMLAPCSVQRSGANLEDT